jgi:hypothetical protein
MITLSLKLYGRAKYLPIAHRGSSGPNHVGSDGANYSAVSQKRIPQDFNFCFDWTGFVGPGFCDNKISSEEIYKFGADYNVGTLGG